MRLGIYHMTALSVFLVILNIDGSYDNHYIWSLFCTGTTIRVLQILVNEPQSHPFPRGYRRPQEWPATSTSMGAAGGTMNGTTITYQIIFREWTLSRNVKSCRVTSCLGIMRSQGFWMCFNEDAIIERLWELSTREREREIRGKFWRSFFLVVSTTRL